MPEDWRDERDDEPKSGSVTWISLADGPRSVSVDAAAATIA